MNIFFEHNNFDSALIAKYYNCSYLTHEQWQQEKSPHLALGLFYLIFGIPLHILYFPVMWVITRPEFFKMPAYKILTFLGIIDFFTSFVTTEITGYFTVIGSIFCSDHPTLAYYSGVFGMAGWTTSCFANLILIFTRTLDMYKPTLGEKLFGGNKTYIWLFSPCVYYAYILVYTRPVIYSSKAVSWMFNPYFGVDQATFPVTDFYHNSVHTFNNIAAVIVLSPMYFLLIKEIFTKVNGISKKTEEMETLKRSMLIQSGVICTFNLLSALVYVIIANVPLGLWASVLAEVGWEFSHLIMSFVLCFMNPSVKKYILKNLIPFNKTNKVNKSVAPTLSIRSVPVTKRTIIN